MEATVRAALWCFAIAIGSAGSRYGVYGYASGGTFKAAGYFDGDIWADSYLILFRQEIQNTNNPTKSSISLEQLMQLKPSAYEFNTAAYPKIGLAEGKQMGLSR